MYAISYRGLFAASLVAIAAGCNAPTNGNDSQGAGSQTAELSYPRLDLNDPADNLTAYVKTRGSLDPKEEVVFYWSGTITSFVPEAGLPTQKTNKVLFKFEGFNVSRFLKVDDGYQMLSREAAFYEDPVTGQILDCWQNPLNGKAVSVVPVWNDPVNFALAASTWRNSPWTSLGVSNYIDENLAMSADVFLAYPSPLPVASYPEYSQSNLYQGAEMFNFFVKRLDLDLQRYSAPTVMSWTRVGQYLPWMQMGQEAGNIIYQTRGMKVSGGYAALPENVRAYVAAHKPEYAHAPDAWPAGQANMTSWKYFKAILARGEYSPTCGGN